MMYGGNKKIVIRSLSFFGPDLDDEEETESTITLKIMEMFQGASSQLQVYFEQVFEQVQAEPGEVMTINIGTVKVPNNKWIQILFELNVSEVFIVFF